MRKVGVMSDGRRASFIPRQKVNSFCVCLFLALLVLRGFLCVTNSSHEQHLLLIYVQKYINDWT